MIQNIQIYFLENFLSVLNCVANKLFIG